MVKYSKRQKGIFDMGKLEILLNNKRKVFSKIAEEMRQIGGGTLNLSYKAGKCYFIEYNEGKQKGISRDKERVYQLARKEFLTRQLDVFAKELRILDKSESRIISYRDFDIKENIIQKYSMLDFTRIIYTEKEREWYRNRESQNPYMKENLRYSTESGVLMRSKSERFIGDFLEKKRCLYRYEPKFTVHGKAIYPDFVILRSDGEVVIWEHLGLMDNADYLNRTMVKIQDYRSIGFVQHRNLICTYEEDLRNKEILEGIYYRYL